MSYITRTQPTTDETPPWQGISFTCPVGSDLLADRLKYAYPDCKTLRQRKHQAAINFLAAELEEMKSKDEKHSATPEVHDNHRFGSPKSELNDFHETSTGTHWARASTAARINYNCNFANFCVQCNRWSTAAAKDEKEDDKRRTLTCTHGDNAEMPDSKQIAKSSEAPSTYHDGSNAPSNLQDSLVTEPSSRQNGQWSAGISREGQSDQLYVHTNQLQQEPPRRLSPGLQGPEWSYPGDGYEAIYPGISSSPSRPFHSPFSPAIGYNEFPSFSPGLDPWNSQGHAMENHEPT
ncbi:hypothetical protein K505DRAFT_386721 [Melanomma pulvis-pyrius CBS 109.77]|uniref:Uncharacterized protein n=1 Tax=Melanomma pulvis-pyrius CBS 109.77 TaxID=1314802 RepID=A0A6A6X9Y2_9PLEO|nr:hypothetical protein K505DRAFT_386721 [Melanomma pulvis-pyrius CBS 109.77]